jgi:hypothetical protein
MIIKIRYQNPQNLSEFIIEELDDSQINVVDYCINLHKTVLCSDSQSCDGENCKIWIELNGEFILTGVID